MKHIVFVFFLLVIGGCQAVPAPPYQIKYERTHGSLCDLYIELDGQWVKFYEDIREYHLIQSNDGRYLVITDFRGYYEQHVKVFIAETQELIEITDWIHTRLTNISDSVLFRACRFVNNEDVEIAISGHVRWAEEKPVVEALEEVRFVINISKAVEELRYR